MLSKPLNHYTIIQDIYMNKFEYCVAIRTVGKAGEKFRQELESLHNQTVKPKHIYIHLAEGFERPDFTVGYEEYITTPKGLVHQRACSADGVDTEFLLILDDDVYFPSDSVEKLYEALMEHDADGIAPDTFPTQNSSVWSKIKDFCAHGVFPRSNDGWAIKIHRNGTFSYNNNPDKGGIYRTQSAAGTALFCRTNAFQGIHYEDELWIDRYPAGTFGEDQIMFYKFHINGYKLLMAYDSGILHLDANTNSASQKTYEKLYYRAMSLYLIWYRSCCDLEGNSKTERLLCTLAYAGRIIMGSLTRIVFSIMNGSPRFITAYIKGNLEARKFVRSEEYRGLKGLRV